MKKMLFFKSRPVFRALLFCALTPLVGKAQDFHAYRDQNGDAYVQWDTTQGYSYTLQSSEDMEFWSTDSTWLGVGQTVSLLVQEAPNNQGGGGGAIPGNPSHTFTVSPYPSGHSLISWRGSDNLP
ncbi:MAG: hypothetical protein ABF337_06775, partial [Akkermansiaceae bacterium]